MSCVEEGFRLSGAPSECSMRSKARIDALFEDSRSVCSSTLADWYSTAAAVNPGVSVEETSSEEQMRVNSAVQARIEAMFASVEEETGIPGECAATILPVQYMGAAPVGGRVASVRGLQEPLRQLLENVSHAQFAELEVSRRGLTVRTNDMNEKANPFRRIAVWSALRLRRRLSATGEMHYAFLPLVGDDTSGSTNDDRHSELYRTMHGLRSEVDYYPPIFAVIMRRPGAARLLECHAFACESEDDAIVAAATLYRALLSDLDANRRRPRQANGVGCMSVTSYSVASSVRDGSPNNRNNHIILTRTTATRPVRPPRSKKSASSASSSAAGSEAIVCSSSSSSTNKSNDKVTKKKSKCNTDVKAEDILEARRKPRDLQKASNNAKSNGKNGKNERASNKTYEAREITADVVTVDNASCVIAKRNANESIYGGGGELVKKASESNAKDIISNNRETRAEKPSVVVADVRVSSPTIVQENKAFAKNDGSYEVNSCDVIKINNTSEGKVTSVKQEALFEKKSIASTTSNNSTCDNVSVHSHAPPPPLPMKKLSQDKIYQEHFKDADKIYSIESDRPASGLQNNHKTSNEAMYSKDHRELPSKEDNPYTCKRLSRVNTLDRPKKSQVPEYSQPRVRRRSRAGSEPPVGRTEDAARRMQEASMRRTQSDIDVDRGDLMTRVELPRRGSFLNPGSSRKINNLQNGTPLGFTELFDEFRNQEGLTSVDDILAAIIDPEGMSFNELKPLYKEFLLKLASTLTQDELYQRSASIMRKRRRPKRRRSVRRPCLLGRAIKRSVSRLKGAGPTEFTSVIFPARRLNSFGSSSSCEMKKNHRNRVLASKMGRRRSSWQRVRGHTTSEDSDTCRRLARSLAAGANRSSSGYVSCSECSYDSETCTCISADKCYCSLSRRPPPNRETPLPVTHCVCDTDSCSESNKCYCAGRPNQPTILEQLRQRGIIPSESTLSRGDSSERVKTVKTSKSHASSKSLEFLKIRRSPMRGSTDNLALDYDLFSPGNKSGHSSGSEKVLVVSARDPQGRLLYVGGGDRDKKSMSSRNSRTGAHHEALSIKKSAEIAAVFGNGSNRVYRRASNASSIRSSASLEAGLGYLP